MLPDNPGVSPLIGVRPLRNKPLRNKISIDKKNFDC